MEDSAITTNSPAMSDDIRQFGAAFLLAKAQFRPLSKTGFNAHQRYSYSRLADIYYAIEEPLNKQGIIISHFSRKIDGVKYFFTRLTHVTSGQWIEDMREFEPEGQGNKGIGAANTYMQKYALISLCALATSEDVDDDSFEEVTFITEQQVKQLQEAIKSANNATFLYSSILEFNKVKDLSQLPVSSFNSVMGFITKNRK
jgi:hypothetical protein